MRDSVRGFGRRFFVALQYEDYRQLWVANAFAQAAAWGLIVARGWFVYHNTHSSFLVGLTTFAAMGPQLLVPAIAGVLADRMDRRTLLAWTYGLNTAHNLALLVLASFGVLEVWMLVALSVMNGTARAAQLPTSQALAASLVPRERLLNALSLQAATQHASRLVGPGLITPLLPIVGAPAAFALCTVFYLIGWANLLKIAPRPASEAAQRQPFLQNFVGGLEYVYSRPMLRFMILLVILHCGLTMAFESLLPVFSHQSLGTGDEGFGVLMLGVGSGAFLGSILVSGINTSKARGNTMVAMGLLSGLGQAVLSLTTALPVATLAAALMGGGQASFMTMGQSVTQSMASEEYRGRVASINAFSLGGIMATMNLLNGSLGDEVGAGSLLLFEGLVFAGVVLLSLLAATGRRIYGRGPALEAAAA
jgi:predicted MFS family arabinose efflux permease